MGAHLQGGAWGRIYKVGHGGASTRWGMGAHLQGGAWGRIYKAGRLFWLTAQMRLRRRLGFEILFEEGVGFGVIVGKFPSPMTLLLHAMTPSSSHP